LPHLNHRMGGNREAGSPDRAIASLATRQYGVVSRRQLLAAGLSARAIERRAEAGRLHRLHYGVYAVGHRRLTVRGRWLAAVLTFGPGSVLSHRSAGALWGLVTRRVAPVEVTVRRARRRPGIAVHEARLSQPERTAVGGIPVTTVARTLFDLAEVVDERQLERACEEADRLGLLEMRALEDVCARGYGRRALRPIRRLVDEARLPDTTRSPLENRFLCFCREKNLPLPEVNVTILGREVDAYWPGHRLVVEADSWSFHGHRAAFERDRARDAAMQVEGYRVIRITHRRLEREPSTVAAELRRLLTIGGERATS
jgi:predicted transcriptional regulator of viral defense system